MRRRRALRRDHIARARIVWDLVSVRPYYIRDLVEATGLSDTALRNMVNKFWPYLKWTADNRVTIRKRFPREDHRVDISGEPDVTLDSYLAIWADIEKSLDTGKGHDYYKVFVNGNFDMKEFSNAIQQGRKPIINTIAAMMLALKNLNEKG